MQATYNIIDWHTAGRLLKQQDYNPHCFIVKFISHRLPLQGGNYMASDDKTCPCCKHYKETALHFLCCTGNKESWA
eukprot:15343644-Ditylum_brightwellii.AAC.1